MYIFIDESGDAGFKLTKGSSTVFVVVLIIFDNKEDMIDTQNHINSFKADSGIDYEFKFSKSRDVIRDGFFAAVKKSNFRIRSIVVQKEKIYSSKLREETESFYNYFLKQLLKHDNDEIVEAKIIIDGSGDREFKKLLSRYIKREISSEKIKEIKFSDSKNDVLIQLADMCAGAIARSYYTDKKNAMRWKNAISSKIKNLWEFK